jgi:hypothetical protein
VFELETGYKMQPTGLHLPVTYLLTAYLPAPPTSQQLKSQQNCLCSKQKKTQKTEEYFFAKERIKEIKMIDHGIFEHLQTKIDEEGSVRDVSSSHSPRFAGTLHGSSLAATASVECRVYRKECY